MRLKIELFGLLFLIIMSIFVVVTFKAYKNEQIKVHNKNNQIEVLTTNNVSYKNKNNELVSETNQYIINVKELRYSNDSITKELYATVTASNLKDKRITELLSIKSEVTIIEKWDSIYIENGLKTFIKTNEWINLKANDTLFNLTIKNDYRVITAKRQVPRWWILGKLGFKKTVDDKLVQVINKNPYDKTEIRSIKIEE